MINIFECCDPFYIINYKRDFFYALVKPHSIIKIYLKYTLKKAKVKSLNRMRGDINQYIKQAPAVYL